MNKSAHKAVAIVGVGAVMPNAPDARTFWQNIKDGRYSISEVPRERWDPELYYDPDPKVPDKTYSKIGGWVRNWEWDPIKWKLPIPPRVDAAMDETQKWGIVATRAALIDYGFPDRALDPERTAVIFGNAMGGDSHYMTATRILFPEYADELANAPSFADLPESIQRTLLKEMREGVGRRFPEITEDTMPGELSNIIAGRIAALFNFRGPNYVTDAACASAMAAISAAIEGLEEKEYDAVVTGGIDRNMNVQTFVKFCKIGALSATGTRPYAEGADGFVMGEGAAIFVLKRLEDAERDGDKIYAVIRSLGGSSDGRGKGITAPNPIGQKLAVRRAWQSAGLAPAAGDLIEGHGTSTRVGDLVEVESLSEVCAEYGVPPGRITLGSVKSNIGHLKGAAGAAGILKATFALHEKVLPPSLNFHKPNPGIDFAKSPFTVNTELKPWEANENGVRRAGVSSFGFGGTNFHAVMEEYIPGRIERERKAMFSMASTTGDTSPDPVVGLRTQRARFKNPLRGALVIGAVSDAALRDRLQAVRKEAESGHAPLPAAPLESDLRASVRIAIDYCDAADLADKAAKALAALEQNETGRWSMLRAKGIFVGRGPSPNVAFLFTGQGSQYVNMLRDLKDIEPIIADTYAEADEVMKPLLGKPLTDYIFVDGTEDEVLKAAEHELKQTAITQPAVLATETALARLLAAYGINPNMVIGHSLGEYGALVASGGLPFDDALRAVSARGGEMTKASKGDNGLMAAAHGPVEEIERIIAGVDGYVLVANHNSTKESVIGGSTAGVQAAMKVLSEAGYSVTRLPVSHAFHTNIVGAAADALVGILNGMNLQPPEIPVIANITGGFYPMHPAAVPEMVDILARQVASPVQFVKGLRTLYDAGVRVFVELGPKRALYGFASDVVGSYEDVTTLFTNHPRVGGIASFNQALCGLYAAGLGVGAEESRATRAAAEETDRGGTVSASAERTRSVPAGTASVSPASPKHLSSSGPAKTTDDRYLQLGQLFAQFLDRGFEIYSGAKSVHRRPTACITGASLGLPGVRGVFDDSNTERILRGDQFIDSIPMKFRHAMANKNIHRLVKGKEGQARFETVDRLDDVIKLAARGVDLNLKEDFGFPEERLGAFDTATMLAIGAGIDALRDAGIPLVMRYKTTTKGTKLVDRWMLPENMRDDTGVIFASVFAGYDSLAEFISSGEKDHARRERLADLVAVRDGLVRSGGTNDGALRDLETRIDSLRAQIDREAYQFNRQFLFRVLAMGHSQFAEYIGARGPNAHVDVACASGTHAVLMAEDWIQNGRCRRVIIVTSDNVTSDNLLEWFASGFLASGAAATDETVEEAAVPFDRRRHGMIIGMGSAAIVMESEEAARERGILPICEVLNTVSANSAFHGSRLDIDHICDVMEKLVSEAEKKWGLNRHTMAAETVFVSHETYTPARGGSASAEIFALRRVFGESADKIVIANTKGFTGHPMGVAIEDVVAIRCLETGIVPPVPNHKEVDPELGQLNLSTGGAYPVRYALRLAAGFGSQIGLSLTRWVPPVDGRRRSPSDLGFHYRISDRNTWNGWLTRATGRATPELEVVNRTLRVKDSGRSAAGLDETVIGPTTVVPPPVPLPVVGKIDEKPPVQPAPAPIEVTPEPRPPVPTAPSRGGHVQESVLRIVSEKTGYPSDMLDLDLDLEADLGIDTVKQAEMFAAIREEYGIPRDDDLKLRDYPTLAHAIRFVFEKRPDLVGEETPAPQREAPEAVETVAGATAEFAATQHAEAPPGDDVTATVLGVISEKTGYPTDMLDLDLDLEADLGIDTVKQAEMFAAIREEYGIPRDDDLKLRDYPTLAHAIQFVYDKRPDLKGGAKGESVRAAAGPRAPGRSGEAAPQTIRAGSMEAADAIPRRIPVARLRPELELFKPTAVELGSGNRVVVMADAGGVGKALVGRLKRRGADVLLIGDSPPTPTLVERVDQWRDQGPIHGVYWLPALDIEGPLGAMDLAMWREANRVRVKLLYSTMRALYDDIGKKGTFLVCATRLGGRHGYDDTGAGSALGGAVTGFAKAFKREKRDALVKCVDLEESRRTAAFADLLIDETLRDPGVVEVGYKDGHRWSIALEEAPAPRDVPGITLDRDTVFVITGAAGAIVSAITADLAYASGGTFHLLDLAPKPAADDADVRRFATDEEGLKREIFERLKASGERATPATVERELRAIERKHAALSAIQAIENAGGTAHYYSVDLLDGGAVATAVEQIKSGGRVDVLVHAAGIEISRTLPDKKHAEFDLVFDVKSDGWFNIMSSLADVPLRAVVVFSSIAGRFGNAGQTDYSAANDLLCKAVSNLRATRPNTRGIAIDWTAWGGIGMASRGSIPAIMKHAGIDMLPPEAGIPIVRRELTAGSAPGEVVIAGSLGIMMEELDSTGGLDTSENGVIAAGLKSKGIMTERLVGMGLHNGLTVETLLDPREQPFLYDHQIDGTPVLPGVMGIEAFAEAAKLIFPGRCVGSVENVDFHSPFKFYRNEPRTVTVHATFQKENEDIVANCRLVGVRKLHGRDEPEITTHFTARVRLVAAPPHAAKHKSVAEATGIDSVEAGDIYKLYFHGPAYQVVQKSWRVGEEVVGLFKRNLPANHEPADRETIAAPRLIELCFQTAGLSDMAGKATMGLPYHIDRLDYFLRAPSEKGGKYFATVETDKTDAFNASVVDTEGNLYLTMKGYRTMQLPNRIEKELLDPLKSRMGAVSK